MNPAEDDGKGGLHIMAGKRKHAARSRVTHRRGLMAAQRFTTPALPRWMRKMLGGR